MRPPQTKLLTRGRQWWNRDTGYGVCPRCGVECINREGPVAHSYYGDRGVHWDVANNHGAASSSIEKAPSKLTDLESALELCRMLETRLNVQKEALEAADECLALIEDVGHGAMVENVTTARSIVLAALAQPMTNTQTPT